MAELGRRARAATPEEAARAGDRVVVSIPPTPYRKLSRRRTVGQGRARHRSVRDTPYDEPDDGRVGLVEPRHIVGDHQQHALGGPGQRTTSRLSGRRRCPGRNGRSRKTGGCMCGSRAARPLPPRLSVLSGPFPVRAVFAAQFGPHAIRTASVPRRPGRPAHSKVPGQHFRILVSSQRPESDAQTLAQPTHDAILQPWADTSAQVRVTSTNADGNGVELTSSGFSPVDQRPESAPQMRRFPRSQTCTVGRVGLEPTADGL
ncbi:hypothetical protein [Streptomyces canus]|uniref:hypothetical protein n=1 Tax=Streptomyces canus TaxID=58343 RepID=UPI003869F453